MKLATRKKGDVFLQTSSFQFRVKYEKKIYCLYFGHNDVILDIHVFLQEYIHVHFLLY